MAYGGVWGVPAIHRGRLPPAECPPARGGAHDGTNLLHRGQQTHSEAPLRLVVAHGELQELPEEDLLGEETVGEDGIVLALAGCAFPLPLAAGALS